MDTKKDDKNNENLIDLDAQDTEVILDDNGYRIMEDVEDYDSEDPVYNEVLAETVTTPESFSSFASTQDMLQEALGLLSQEDLRQIIGELDPIAWIENVRTIKGKPFGFHKRNYLLDIYRDNSRHIILYKGRQVEMTEFALNWCFRKMYEHPYTAALHAFPRDKQVLRVSKQRIQPAIKDSKFLTEWQNKLESDQRMLKFVRDKDPKTGLEPYNFYVMGGTWEGSGGEVGDAARGLTIDFVAYDERQDHPNDVEAVVGEAMSHSEFKQSLTLGTPKLPGTQFDNEWESSDKLFWHNTCDKCGMEQTMTLENILECDDHNVELEIAGESQEYYYGCKRCFAPIDRVEGRWIATNPQKRAPYRGYHLSQLIVPWISAQEIMDKYGSVKYTRRKFFNEVLGYAYGGDEVPITQAAMNAIYLEGVKMHTHSDEDIYVGIDWGKKSWMWIEKKVDKDIRQLVQVEVCSDEDPRNHPKVFAKIISKYGRCVKRVVNDAGPDIVRHKTLTDELLECGVKAPVMACYYATPPAKVELKWNEKEKLVTAGRSEFVEIVAEQINSKKLILPGASKDIPIMTLVDTHFTALSSERIKRPNGQEFIIYTPSGDDHLLHAKIYATIAGSEESSLDHVGSTASNFQSNRQSTISHVESVYGTNDLYGALKKPRGHNDRKMTGFTQFNNRRRKGRLR